MSIRKVNMNEMLILCLTLVVVLSYKILHVRIAFLGKIEKLDYLCNITISCLNLLLCCIVYIMILVYSNIKLMFFLLSKFTDKNPNQLNSIILKLLDTRLVGFILFYFYLKILSIVYKDKLYKKSKVYESSANKINIIIHSIEHHRKLYENFVLSV